MAVVSLRVCDVCAVEPAETYTIECGGKMAKTDLCKAHGEPLDSYLNNPSLKVRKARSGASGKPEARSRTGRRPPKVMTMEEIEALKLKPAK